MTVCDIENAPGASQQPVIVESARLGPGVLIGFTDGTVYVMASGGGIDAVGIATGKSRWQTKKASEPLLVHDDRLIAVAEPSDPHTLTIVTLNADSGVQINSGRLGLPHAVRASIDDEANGSFTVSGDQESRGVRIGWEYLHRQLSGQIDPEGSKSPSVLRGVAMFDPATGTIRESAYDRTPPATDDDDRRRAGNYLIELEPSKTNSKDSTVVRRWSSTDRVALPTVEIPGVPGSIGVSVDGQYACVIAGARADEQGVVSYPWSVYSLADGHRIGDARLLLRTTPFFVSETTLIYEAPPMGRRVRDRWTNYPLRVVAVDLGTHQELWTHPVRDTKFQGSQPPNLP